MPSEIEHIIAGCIKGDRVSQKLLYKRLSSKLMGVCMRYTKNRQEAEDCLQEVFIKIFNSIEEFKNEGLIEAWARRIAVNTVLNHINKNKKHKLQTDISENIETEIIINYQPNIIDQEALINMINLLPETYKLIFNLHAIEGFSHKEICNELSINESTSRVYLTRAKEMLANMYKKLNSIQNEKITG